MDEQKLQTKTKVRVHIESETPSCSDKLWLLSWEGSELWKIVKFGSTYSLGTECKPVLLSMLWCCLGAARPQLLPKPFTIDRKRKKKNSTSKCQSKMTNLQE